MPLFILQTPCRLHHVARSGVTDQVPPEDLPGWSDGVRERHDRIQLYAPAVGDLREAHR